MKRKVLIIIIAVIVGILVGFLSFYLAGKINEKNEQKTLQSLIANHNDINKIYKKISKNDKYINESSDKCYLYNGNDSENVIKLIDSTYYNSFSKYSIFEKDNNKLYICMPDNCNSIKVDINKTKIKKKEDNRIIFKYKNTEYVLIKDKNIWKISTPIIKCDLTKTTEKVEYPNKTIISTET